jgi:hypothetical protein
LTGIYPVTRCTNLLVLYSFFCLDTKESIKEKVKALFYPFLPAGKAFLQNIFCSSPAASGAISPQAGSFPYG